MANCGSKNKYNTSLHSKITVHIYWPTYFLLPIFSIPDIPSYLELIRNVRFSLKKKKKKRSHKYFDNYVQNDLK